MRRSGLFTFQTSLDDALKETLYPIETEVGSTCKQSVLISKLILVTYKVKQGIRIVCLFTNIPYLTISIYISNFSYAIQTEVRWRLG